MSLKHGLLGLLKYEGSATGYELDKIFKNSLSNFWQAKTSQVYRELNTMEELGWLTSERIIQEDKPNKRKYTVTPKGVDEFMEWLTSPLKSLGGAKSELLMRIFFSADLPKGRTIAFLEGLKAEQVVAQQRLDEIEKFLDEEEKNKHTVYWRITLLQGQIVLKAYIEWLDKSIQILKDEGDN